MNEFNNEGAGDAQYETEEYTPGGELLKQLHWRLDPTIEEYRREGKSDDRRAAPILPDGSSYEPRSIIRDYITSDQHLIRLRTQDGPRLTGRVDKPSLVYDRPFSVFIKVSQLTNPRYAVSSDGDVTPPAEDSQAAMYTVEEAPDGPQIYDVSQETPAPLDPAATEQLLWQVQSSTPLPQRNISDLS